MKKLFAPRLSLCMLLIMCALILDTTISLAAVPGLISYQGRLTTPSGAPVADGAYLIKFQIYDSAVGGSVLWNSNYQSVQAKDGLYTYLLGQDVPFPSGLFTGGNRWLGITVGVDPELTPRMQFVATGYAIASQNADSVNWSGIKNVPAGFADGIDDNSGGDITAVNTSGGLTGGAASGTANLSIATGGVTSAHIADGQIFNADINASANIDATKIAGTAATLSGTQTFTGKKTFTDSVAFFDNTLQVNNSRVTIGDTPGMPLFGSFLTIEKSYYTYSLSPLNGIWVQFTNSGSGLVRGGYFFAGGTSGGVRGLETTAMSDGSVRLGALIDARMTSQALNTGTTWGILCTATDGAECYGVSTAATRGIKVTGVQGTARLASQEGVGVLGRASDNPVNGLGVYGGATANGVGVGVYGEAWANSVSNWAGYFGGDVNVTGTVFMPAKISRIDHPLDPENKYLQQADVQSPDMLNVYTGNVVTNGSGDAQVQLPGYFIAINSDFRYQLTVVGQFAQAIISSEIQDNRFSIKTDKPSVKVSWQVTGIRQDKYAQAHRVNVEVDKPAYEAGKYLHPELYGLGEDRGMTSSIRASALQSLAKDREQSKDSTLGSPPK